MRPFSQRHGLKHRGASLRLERALVDFGAEESFERAASRVQEHYGVKVSVWRVRWATYQHARACGSCSKKASAQKAATLITQMDGSMIPTVKTAARALDKRPLARCSGARRGFAWPGPKIRAAPFTA